METKHVKMDAKQQKQVEDLLHGIMKERKVAVEANLDSRLSYREKDPKNPKAASWTAYSRFLLSDGHTVYVSLRTMKASVSDKPDKFAQAKVEKRLAKQKKAEERKEAKAAKAAAKPEPEAPKAEVKAKTTVKPKAKKTPQVIEDPEVGRVQFDPKLSTLDAAGHTTPPAVKSTKRSVKA